MAARNLIYPTTPDVIDSGAATIDAISPALAERLAETFKVLGDATRVRILSTLAGHELCVYDLSDALQMSQSAISHQLGVLRRMHLVRTRRQGRQVYYALDDDHIEQLFQRGLEHVLHTSMPSP